jgi:hypothetical protein
MKRHACVEHRSRHVEAAQRNSLPAQAKAANRPRLLYGCIEPSLDSKEFFLSKAIGWALRSYAWTDLQKFAGTSRPTRPPERPQPARGAQERGALGLMPATPAWPPRSAPRLFVPVPLARERR